MNNRKAFTLIELLVVIAIIAILAAILFPVFAQAKAAAKNTTGLSNVKQLALSTLMYASDSDDNRPPRVVQDIVGAAVVDEHSWKELVAPYVKSVQMFQDSQNVGRVYPDYHSDPVVRAGFAWTPVTLPSNLNFAVSYHLVNTSTDQQFGFANGSAVPFTSYPNPSTVGLITEGHTGDADLGPYQAWAQLKSTDWAFGSTPSALVGQWNLGGNAYSNKASNAAFSDGHAKRIPYSVRDCTAYNAGATGTTTDFWNNTGANVAANSWEATNCTTLPAALK